VGSFFIAVSVVVFALHADFAPGGINGMGLILHYLTGFPIGKIVLALNLPILLLVFKYLGKAFVAKSVKTMIISSLFLDHVAIYLPTFPVSRLMAAVFSGVFAGIGFALIYLQDSSTGGSDFLILTVKKVRPTFSIGQITRILDGSVILLAAFVFRQIDAVAYGLLYTFINSLTIDFIMNHPPVNLGALVGRIIPQPIRRMVQP
jgi:uncharacterized membrane-anchored protein YitT (DUF2179 family)